MAPTSYIAAIDAAIIALGRIRNNALRYSKRDAAEYRVLAPAFREIANALNLTAIHYDCFDTAPGDFSDVGNPCAAECERIASRKDAQDYDDLDGDPITLRRAYRAWRHQTSL